MQTTANETSNSETHQILAELTKRAEGPVGTVVSVGEVMDLLLDLRLAAQDSGLVAAVDEALQEIRNRPSMILTEEVRRITTKLAGL